jgi:hypothetical protein
MPLPACSVWFVVLAGEAGVRCYSGASEGHREAATKAATVLAQPAAGDMALWQRSRLPVVSCK